MRELIDKLEQEKLLSKEEFVFLLDNKNDEIANYLFEKSVSIRKKNYSNDVYIRGLIEFSNYCKNDCYYCGIRRSNKTAERYRLTKEEILDCCKSGYELGFRTFVLQGGEDPYFTDEVFVDIIESIKREYPDCAITLSLGERSFESYQKLKNAGADRYLLRFETSTEDHYNKLHPENLTIENRKKCLFNLKKTGFAVGGGFMVGSPYQTNENIANDLLLLNELQPEMVGIGPFIAHHATPFSDFENGKMEDTLFILALVRLMLPKVLLPSTTALGTVNSEGRLKGILVGCNVIMPNLSPSNVRSKYLLYDNKAYTGSEAAESLENLKKDLKEIGYKVSIGRGDPL